MTAIESKVNPTVKTRLLNSGHYATSSNQRITSVHLSELRLARGYLAFPPLIAGNAEDIKLGLKHGGYPIGIKNYVRIEEPGHPAIYVVDNHQGAYWGWLESLALGNIKTGAELIHIDHHQDSFRPFSWPTDNSLPAAMKYLIEELRVEDFILPLVANGTISRFWNILSSPYSYPLNYNSIGNIAWATESAQATFSDHPLYDGRLNRSIHGRAKLSELLSKLKDPAKAILDIDLDAFVRKDYLANDLPSAECFAECCRFIADIASYFGVITIATSPCFADQQIAVMVARRMVKEIIARQ